MHLDLDSSAVRINKQLERESDRKGKHIPDGHWE